MARPKASTAARPRSKSVSNPRGVTGFGKAAPSSVTRGGKVIRNSEKTSPKPMPRVPAVRQPK